MSKKNAEKQTPDSISRASKKNLKEKRDSFPGKKKKKMKPEEMPEAKVKLFRYLVISEPWKIHVLRIFKVILRSEKKVCFLHRPLR